MSEHTKSSIFSGASPKLTFIMGVVVGVAAVSLIGFVIAVVMSFGGGASGWAKLGRNSEADKLTAANNQAANNQAPAKVDVQVKPDDYIRGDRNAPLTLIEYSDLECPYCKRFHETMLQLMQDYSGQVRWIYRHFPLSFHANAQKEAEAAECAGKLGSTDKYWSYIDKIFARTVSNGTGFALADLPKLARELGLNEASFKSCLDSGEMATKVQADLQAGSSYGVSGTPTTFVNGQVVEGAVPYSELKLIIEAALKLK